jgi:uncharacterized membrane protein YqaE (UPF0057 family)
LQELYTLQEKKLFHIVEPSAEDYIFNLIHACTVVVNVVMVSAVVSQMKFLRFQISVQVEDQTQLLLAILIPLFVVVFITGSCGIYFWIRAKKEPPPLIPNDTYHLVVSVKKTLR